MTVLDPRLRRTLENVIREARTVAEDAAADAIERLGIAAPDAPAYLSDDQKALRRRLRAHARSLGDSRDANGTMSTGRLGEAAGYELWHRMLFGRFLMERNLLLHPEYGVPISLADAQEIAAEDKDRFPDEWAVAEHFAAPTLPMVFKPDDPVLALEVDPHFHARLRGLLTGLPTEVFAAHDSLGWTYQFWRAAEKEAVNLSGVKIGAAELPAVTQLFTEPYMVMFLLHNTIGAWWAGKVLAARPDLGIDAVDEQALRDACALPGIPWEFLRFVREDNGKGPWRPAAGSFPRWPLQASEITFCDPCCGSGHFLIEAFIIFAAIRQAEEGLSPDQAARAVLRENLHGLEIDGRCVQIAAFNVALTGWEIAGGPVPLPLPHIAWVGAPPPLPKKEFAALGEGDAELEYALAALHDLFAQAPVLGSLLEPTGSDLFETEKMREVERLLEPLLAKVRRSEPERAEGVIAARGMADAAALLHRRFCLAITNPPFLGQGEFSNELMSYVTQRYKRAKGDLSTVFLERMHQLVYRGGTIAAVTKQEWCFLPTFYKFRKHVLDKNHFRFFVFLGEEAWEAFGNRGPKATLLSFDNAAPADCSTHFVIDVTAIPNRNDKTTSIKTITGNSILQSDQYQNPKSRILSSKLASGTPLSEYAHCYNGIVTGDANRFIRRFWEIMNIPKDRWIYQQTATENGRIFSGMDRILRWDSELHSFIKDRLGDNPGAWLRGIDAWGKNGIVVSGMRYLNRGIYVGSSFDNNCSIIVAKDPENTPAIWSFCASSGYVDLVKSLNPKVSVTDDTFVQVPFDLHEWKKIATDVVQNALPEPYSSDPDQWLFHGHPAKADKGTALHVALARIAGYRWPAETDNDVRLSEEARDWIAKASLLPHSDSDGLLVVSATAGERSLADRLSDHLAAAFGNGWSSALERRLVVEADERFDKKPVKDTSLEGWLRNRAFRQHCVLFQQRPFIWHVWDGLPDGFSVFVHYHRLDRAALEKLTYSLLGDWIARAKAEGQTAREEQAQRLQQGLAAILQGEAPYDIFARWKAAAREPLGWEPDLDDGVRLNIRPFVTAGVLREIPKGIHWNKDLGGDVASAPWYDLGPRHGGKPGDRINDHHLMLAEKRAARERIRQ